MADGSIQFDTALNTDGVISGLESLAKNAEGAAKEVAKALDGGILGGIENIGITALASMQTLSGAADAAAQKMIESGTLTEEEITKIRQNAQQIYRKNLQKQSEDFEDMQDREFRYLKNSLELGLISETDYYQQLAALRDQYFARGSDGWEKYTMEILEHNRNMVVEQKKLLQSIFEDMAKEIGESADEMQRTQDKLAEKLSDFGGLYDDVTMQGGGHKTTFMRLHDIQADVALLQEYNDALSTVKGRVDQLWTTEGVAEEEANRNAELRKAFFSEIRDMSVMEGLEFANTFLGQSLERAEEYLRAWGEKADLSKDIAKNLYGEETKEFMHRSIDTMAEDIRTRLEERFGELPVDFFAEGVASALGFQEGFISELDAVFTQLQKEIAAKTAELTADINTIGTQNTQNVTNYTIYGAESPYNTAIQIEKQEVLKRMLAGG